MRQAKPAEAKDLFNAHRNLKTDRVDYRDFLKYFLLNKKGGLAAGTSLRPGTVGGTRSPRPPAVSNIAPPNLGASFYSKGSPSRPKAKESGRLRQGSKLPKGFLARPAVVDGKQQMKPATESRKTAIPASVKSQVAAQWKPIRRACQAIDTKRQKQIAARDMLAVFREFGIEVTVQEMMALPGQGAPGPMRSVQYNGIIKACLA
jgi:hypothetical protein